MISDFENFGYVLATGIVAKERQKVGFMYREEPDKPGDSGWRFYSNTESQAYIDNPDNIQIYDIKTIIDIDPDILPYLDAEIGTCFERCEGTNEFAVVTDC